jgi:HAMP domain-containing protein
MKVSIRFKILVGVVLVNLLGAMVTMVYLHQSYSGGVAADATRSLTETNATWVAVQKLGGSQLGKVTDPKAAAAYLAQMKEITGSDFAMLIDKQQLDKATYAKARQAAGLPDNYDEGTTYVQVALTNDELAKEFQFNPTPDSVPEIGKLVGVKNGACSKLCHGSVSGHGDYWGVTWSDQPGVTQAHAVMPVTINNKPIGVLYSIQDFSAQADAARASMIQTLLVIGITLLIATIAIGMMIDLWVFRRLARMTGAIEDISMRVAGGDFDAHFEPDGTGDEIGKFEEFFARFMDLISATLKSMSS